MKRRVKGGLLILGDVQSTVSDGDRDWRAESLNHQNNRHSRPVSAAPRGRWRTRGGRAPGKFGRNGRGPNEAEYFENGADFSQVTTAFKLKIKYYLQLWF